MRIFIADDDPVQRLIILDALTSADDTTREFANGESLLAAMDDAPDLILLDIEMPGMDGIAACRALREAGHELAQVIFISSHDDAENRLAAYAAGGSDFIVKPVDDEELAFKVEAARKFAARQQSFLSDIQHAQRTAFTAMSSMGELGVVLQFLQKSFACADDATLAAAVLEAIGQYGLHGIVELRPGDVGHAYSSRGDCSPLELSVLAHVRGMERIFRFRSQMSIHYPHATLVIMNLPPDEDFVGRLRDHLAVLVEGANARVAAIASEQQQLIQSRAIVASTRDLGEVLATIDARQADNRQRVMAAGTRYLHEMTGAFVHMGLTEIQEASLCEMAQGISEEVRAIVDEGSQTATQLRMALACLRNLGL
jgi:CheY-like chemotaxis protein